MNTKTYRNENLIAYLLGALPEAEAEIFDELSFTDDDFAEELSAAEKDLVDAYVNGELKGERLEKFESYYLASPLRRKKAEFAGAFQKFARKEIAEKPVAVVESKPKRVLAGIFSEIFITRRPLLQWGFALAALVFMILGGWLFWENSRLRSEISQSETNHDELLRREAELKERERILQDELANRQTANSETEKELATVREEREKLVQELEKQKLQERQQIIEQKRRNEQIAETKKTPSSSPNRSISVASFILTPPVRGNPPTLSIPDGINSVAIQLELEADDYAVYRVALQNASNGQILWQSGKIKSKTRGANKVLNVGFAARLLKPQIYSLEVSGILPDGTAEPISSYSFKVVR